MLPQALELERTRLGGFLDESETAAAWASHLMVNMTREMRRPCDNPKISKAEFVHLAQGYKDVALVPQLEERELKAPSSSCSKGFGGRRYVNIRLNLARLAKLTFDPFCMLTRYRNL